MNIKNITIIILILLASQPLQAQKKKGKIIAKPRVVTVEEPQEDPRIVEMRDATQQIIFIDSIVVDKHSLLSAIRINPETGKLTAYDTFFNREENPDGYVFLNEIGNKCYFSNEDDNSHMQLYTSDKLGSEWSTPTLIKGISDGITDANYPFMMTDGTTFYFAAKGRESIGGYDIFVTRYDSEDGKFLKPENIGMPFNSEANDYMYVVDELSRIGYFATDRRQPQGKICVYTFIPPTSRKTYNLDSYSDQQLRDFASISRIANTWGNGKERKEALARKKAIHTEVTKQAKPEMSFVINDQITYNSESQFKNPECLSMYRELKDTQKRLSDVRKLLEKSRAFYGKAKPDDKSILRTEILDAEKQEEQLSADVRELSKKIRNAENRIINP